MKIRSTLLSFFILLGGLFYSPLCHANFFEDLVEFFSPGTKQSAEIMRGVAEREGVERFLASVNPSELAGLICKSKVTHPELGSKGACFIETWGCIGEARNRIQEELDSENFRHCLKLDLTPEQFQACRENYVSGVVERVTNLQAASVDRVAKICNCGNGTLDPNEFCDASAPGHSLFCNNQCEKISSEQRLGIAGPLFTNSQDQYEGIPARQADTGSRPLTRVSTMSSPVALANNGTAVNARLDGTAAINLCGPELKKYKQAKSEFVEKHNHCGHRAEQRAIRNFLTALVNQHCPSNDGFFCGLLTAASNEALNQETQYQNLCSAEPGSGKGEQGLMRDMVVAEIELCRCNQGGWPREALAEGEVHFNQCEVYQGVIQKN